MRRMKKREYWCTWFWGGAVIVEHRVQEIAEVSFFWVAMHSVLVQHIVAITTTHKNQQALAILILDHYPGPE